MQDGQGEAIFRKWQEGEENIQKKIYMQLVVFLFGYLRQEIGYQEEDKSAQGICCYADEILHQIVSCCQKGSSQYTLEEIFSYLNYSFPFFKCKQGMKHTLPFSSQTTSPSAVSM